jgi:hypothetical protein
MPWDAYQSTSDFDLTALYNFLEKLPPVKNGVATFVPKQKRENMVKR